MNDVNGMFFERRHGLRRKCSHPPLEALYLRGEARASHICYGSPPRLCECTSVSALTVARTTVYVCNMSISNPIPRAK